MDRTQADASWAVDSSSGSPGTPTVTSRRGGESPPSRRSKRRKKSQRLDQKFDRLCEKVDEQGEKMERKWDELRVMLASVVSAIERTGQEGDQ